MLKERAARWSSLLALVAAASSAAQEPRFNIYTVDVTRPGKGDIVSNWVASKHLAATTRGEVNFYIAPAHHQKFRELVPQFDPQNQQEPYVFRVTEARRVNVYWQQIPVYSGPRTCNLAFTIDEPLHLTAAVQVLDHGPPLVTRGSEGHRVLNETALTGATDESVTPFLMFSVPKNGSTERLDWKKTGYVMLAAGQVPGRIWPALFFDTTFLNKSLFVSAKETPRHEPIGGGIHYFGYAYASENALVTDYINQIRHLADAQPERRFAVVVPTNVTIDAEPPQGEVTPPWFPSGLDEITPVHRVQIRPNLAVFVYPNSVPYEVAERLIANSNLPILISGTMSLSQAVQFGKPFLYEVKDHHALFAQEMGEHLVESTGEAHKIMMSADRFHQGIPLYNVIGKLDEQGISDAVRASRQAGRLLRNQFLFGISSNGNDGPTVDWDQFQANYMYLQAQIVRYRQGWNPPQPKRHMLDDLPRFCGVAEATLRKISGIYGQANRRPLASGDNIDRDSALGSALTDLQQRLSQ